VSATSYYNNGTGQFRWRFCFASQIIPVVLIIIGSFLIPESPRWLVKVGREREAYDIIAAIRSNGDKEDAAAKREYLEIVQVVELEREHEGTNYIKMFLGVGSGEIHLGRRIQLAFWLQVLSMSFCLRRTSTVEVLF
jgi:hypothetical protein